MNRESFIHNIDNMTSTDIINAFDSVMALYNLCHSVCSYDNVRICKTSKVASFDLTFENEDNAKILHNQCNGLNIPIYDILYHIDSTLEKNVCHINLQV